MLFIWLLDNDAQRYATRVHFGPVHLLAQLIAKTHLRVQVFLGLWISELATLGHANVGLEPSNEFEDHLVSARFGTIYRPLCVPFGLVDAALPNARNVVVGYLIAIVNKNAIHFTLLDGDINAFVFDRFDGNKFYFHRSISSPVARVVCVHSIMSINQVHCTHYFVDPQEAGRATGLGLSCGSGPGS
jgi:hypothetical protein